MPFYLSLFGSDILFSLFADVRLKIVSVFILPFYVTYVFLIYPGNSRLQQPRGQVKEIWHPSNHLDWKILIWLPGLYFLLYIWLPDFENLATIELTSWQPFSVVVWKHGETFTCDLNVLCRKGTCLNSLCSITHKILRDVLI